MLARRRGQSSGGLSGVSRAQAAGGGLVILSGLGVYAGYAGYRWLGAARR